MKKKIENITAKEYLETLKIKKKSKKEKTALTYLIFSSFIEGITIVLSFTYLLLVYYPISTINYYSSNEINLIVKALPLYGIMGLTTGIFITAIINKKKKGNTFFTFLILPALFTIIGLLLGYSIDFMFFYILKIIKNILL